MGNPTDSLTGLATWLRPPDLEVPQHLFLEKVGGKKHGVSYEVQYLIKCSGAGYLGKKNVVSYDILIVECQHLEYFV